MKRVYQDYSEQKNKKGELILRLQTHKGIFSESVYKYLYALINNDFSVVRNYISDEERRVLSNLDIFHQISMYNINKRALNIFKKFDSPQVSELDITTYSSKEVPRVTAEIGSSEVTLFGTNNSCIKLDNPYKFWTFSEERTVTSPIVIPLYKSIIDPQKKYAECERIKKELEHWETAKNPFTPECVPRNKKNKYVGSGRYASQWVIDKQLKIESLKRQLEEINKEIANSSPEENQIISDITCQIFDLFLEDYGLQEEDINEKQREVFEEEKETHKKYVKKMPGLTIERNITYL